MSSTKIALLINRHSRKSARSRKAILQSLANAGISVAETYEISDDTDIAHQCQKIIASRPSLLIIGGGDGTVSSALHHLAGSNIDIGIVPLGTTNNFARSLRLPGDIDEAVDIIKRCQAHPVDLGTVNGQHFANVVGIGLSTVIARQVNDHTKRRFGRLAYAIVGLQQLTKHRAFIVTVTDSQGEVSSALETHQVIIANGRYHAGRQIAADVAVDNRELVVFTLGGRGWLSFVWHTLDFYLGRRRKIAHGSYITGRKLVVTTSRQEVVEIDGEPGTSTPLELGVRSGAVNIRYKL